MAPLPGKYVNPFTDFGFKLIFGEEPHKDLLLDFLNELLRGRHGTINDLTYLKNEQVGRHEADRRAIFDLYCITDRGERFIVEMQKVKHNYFKDRTVFYSSFPIQQQAREPNWNYELNAVYTIAILDFVFDEDRDRPDKFLYEVKLTDIETCKVFYDKLTFVYLEMPKFRKEIGELETRFEKWLYVLKNLYRLDKLPDSLREQMFEKLFRVAEIARFTPDQTENYMESLKVYRDNEAVISYAKQVGKAEGIEKGRVEGMEKGITVGMEKGITVGKEEREKEIALGMLEKGFRAEEIAELTGLPEDEILKLKIHKH